MDHDTTHEGKESGRDGVAKRASCHHVIMTRRYMVERKRPKNKRGEMRMVTFHATYKMNLALV